MVEIVKGSKTRAQAMVDAAIKVKIHRHFHIFSCIHMFY